MTPGEWRVGGGGLKLFCVCVGHCVRASYGSHRQQKQRETERQTGADDCRRRHFAGDCYVQYLDKSAKQKAFKPR